MTTQTTTPTADGEQRKADAHSLLAARRELYVLRGRRALLTALCYRGSATADDVRNAVKLPSNIDPVCLGAVPGALARAGIIESDGFKKSCRARAHARPVQVWRLVDRVAALNWLRTHLDRPAPTPNADGTPNLFSENEPSPTAATVGLSTETNE